MSERRKPNLAEMMAWTEREEAKWRKLFEACREFSEKVSERLEKPEVED